MRLFIPGLVILFLCPVALSAQPLYRMGQQQFATDCAGRLTDSGGPDGPYANDELVRFTICPSQPTECIRLSLAPFMLEAASEFFSGDQIQFYAGADSNAPLIAEFDGTSSDTLILLAQASCVTVVFHSNSFVTMDGFDLTWSCMPEDCTGTTFTDPEVLSGIPATVTGSTCTDAATFSTAPCGEVAFLNGPERIFAVDSPGGWCVDASLQTGGADLGLLVLTAPPDDPASICLVQAPNGQASGIDLRNPGRYYFVVAGEVSCGDFSLTLAQGSCLAPQGLQQALCNPLNACLAPADTAFSLTFSDGFQDIPIIPGQNSGCWLEVGEQPDFRWFGLLARENGQLAFELSSGDLPSDLDVNVWGPFSPEEACRQPQAIISAIRTQAPIRSSFSGDFLPTGLLPVNPRTGDAVTDDYDCSDDPNSSGDGYVRPIDTQTDQLYIVLVNDYGNAIRNGTIRLDVSASTPGVLSSRPAGISDVPLICPGDTVTMQVVGGQGTIRWLEDSSSLLDTTGYQVQALPQKTTLYRAEVSSFCTVDTIQSKVMVAGLNLPDTVALCRGERFLPEVLPATAARYQWRVDGPLQLSCTDCMAPEVWGTSSGTGQLIGTLTAENCSFTDTVSIRITTDSVPAFQSRTDTVLCAGNDIQLNDVPQTDISYAWFLPQGQLFSNDPQPVVAPRVTTEYRVILSDSLCGSTVDTVRVEVIQPVRRVSLTVTDNRICAGDSVTLRATVSQNNPRETFTWIGSDGTMSMDSVWVVVPQETTDYELVYDPGACRSFALDTRIQVEQPLDLTLTADPNPVARGETVVLTAQGSQDIPEGSRWLWREAADDIAETDTNYLSLRIQETTQFQVVLETPFGCLYQAEETVDILAFRSDMPNAFSPNGDGVNDYFNLVYRSGEPEFRDFRVFNRWGELVYNNETPEQGWDGTYRGKAQPADVYIYRLQVITPEGAEQIYEGEVTLIR